MCLGTQDGGQGRLSPSDQFLTSLSPRRDTAIPGVILTTKGVGNDGARPSVVEERKEPTSHPSEPEIYEPLEKEDPTRGLLGKEDPHYEGIG